MKNIDFSGINLQTSCFSGLSQYFEASSLEDLGKQVRFVERSSSRLDSWMFLQLNTCLIDNAKEVSLNDMVGILRDNFNVKMTKQSLDERFNSYSVSLMRNCFEQIFEQILPTSKPLAEIPSGFKRVILRDATSFQLPAHLSSFYQGNGGDTTGSVIKIQQEYDLLSGKILRLDLRNGIENDAEWVNQKGLDVCADDLHLMDLGYYKLETLKNIDQQGGYFVSRYKTNTSLFTKNVFGNFEVLDWEDTLSLVSGDAFEQEVWLGTDKQKFKVRLHLQRIPLQAAEKRLKKHDRKQKNISSKQRKYQNTALKKELAHFNIFITNASVERLKAAQIYEFYRLRWQIELLFKIWKSLFEIDKIGQISIYRFECYLYGKLIAILLGGYIQTLFRDFIEDKIDFELSEWKAYKFVKKN